MAVNEGGENHAKPVLGSNGLNIQLGEPIANVPSPNYTSEDVLAPETS